MNNFDEYVHYVVGANINGCVIEWFNYSVQDWTDEDEPEWDWLHNTYRIELPEGYEYVIEDGYIAFREPTYGESYLDEDYKIQTYQGTKSAWKFPIIKRITK